MLRRSIPSNNIIGLESCSKKLEVAPTQSTVSPRADGRRVAKGLTGRLVCAGNDALNRAHPPPTGTSNAIATAGVCVITEKKR